MATVRPLGDRVLVKVVARERVTTGGVILPDQAREQSDRGLVLAVGPGTPFDAPPLARLRSTGAKAVEGETGWGVHVPEDDTVEVLAAHRPLPVQPGEVVLFSPYAGSKVTHGKDDYLLLREHDILGVLDGVEVEEDLTSGELRIKDPEPAAV